MWDLVVEVFKQQLPEDKFNRANKRFPMFRAAYGTVSECFPIDLGELLGGERVTEWLLEMLDPFLRRHG